MIGCVTPGTKDRPKALAFYERLLGALGATPVFESDRGIAWGTSLASPGLGVLTRFDGQPAARGNGTMVAPNFFCMG
jgi:catechol 2,3-dioxygenase-like lactoylglutathione lyase family enzyme